MKAFFGFVSDAEINRVRTDMNPIQDLYFWATTT